MKFLSPRPLYLNNPKINSNKRLNIYEVKHHGESHYAVLVKLKLLGVFLILINSELDGHSKRERKKKFL